MVERVLGKDEVTSSTLVSSSKNPERIAFGIFTYYLFTFHYSLFTIHLQVGIPLPYVLHNRHYKETAVHP